MHSVVALAEPYTAGTVRLYVRDLCAVKSRHKVRSVERETSENSYVNHLY